LHWSVFLLNLLDNTICVEAWKYPNVNNKQVGKFCGLKKLAQEINRYMKTIKDCVIRQSCSYKRGTDNYNSALTQQTTGC